MSTYRIPPTLSPCPDWCGLSRGHGFDSIDHDGRPVRSHERVVAESFGVTVALVQAEVEVSNALETLPRTSVIFHRSPADPEIWVDSGEPLTGPQARELASWLVIAADEWEEART